MNSFIGTCFGIAVAIIACDYTNKSDEFNNRDIYKDNKELITNQVIWLGSPITIGVTNDGNYSFQSENLMSAYRSTKNEIQIGLRNDGVVIWRIRPEFSKIFK